MNQQIVDYLHTNKDSYSQESLMQQLKNAGHKDEDIQEAIKAVYENNDGEVAIPTPNADSSNINDVKYAGFWIRFVAIFIDGLVLMIPNAIIYFIIVMFVPGSILVSQFVVFLVVLLYFVFMTDKYQATLGKKAVGIKVCDANTLQKSESGHIWMREFINRLLLMIPFLALLEIVVAFTQKKQGLHDMAAKTVVVYKDSTKKISGGVIAAIIIIGVLVLIAIIGIYSSIVLVSLNSARKSAQNVSVKSSISSTVPATILCMDDGQNITTPIPNKSICNGSNGTWPELSETGQWGELIDGDVSDDNFEYTASYSNGEEFAICTELGCEFSDSSY